LRVIDVAHRLGAAYTHACISLDGDTGMLARMPPSAQFRLLTSRRLPAGLRGCREMARLIRRSAADLVCTYNWGSMDWALAAGWLAPAAHLHFESGFGPEEAVRTLRRRDVYRRLALRRTDRLIVPSLTLERLARARRWIDPDRLRHVPNGVDTRWYCRSIRRADATAAPRLAAVAPLRREKRLDRLIDALRQASSGATLTICGDGPERAALESQVRDAGLGERVRFVGLVKDIRPFLDSADIFAMTSETEQMPNALLQAMAMELPVIAYDAGDIRHILPDAQSPFVVAQSDGDGLAEGLRRLIADPALRMDLGRANRRRVEEAYAMEAMVSAYDSLYRDAIGGRE